MSDDLPETSYPVIGVDVRASDEQGGIVFVVCWFGDQYPAAIRIHNRIDLETLVKGMEQAADVVWPRSNKVSG